MKRERKFLISAGLLLILFVLLVNFNIQKQNARIKHLRTVLDDKLSVFDAKAFERAVPYINKLIDHYGHTKIESEGYSENVREFDESVKRYVLNRKIENFEMICQVLKDIREKNQVNTLKELITFRASPITLAIFFLSPLPTTFKSNSQSEIIACETIMKDKVLKYLAVLRLANIYRGIITKSTWFEVYDNEKFIQQYGNVLSITKETLYKLIPALNLPKNVSDFIDFDDLLNDSKADFEIIEMNSKLRLDLSIEDLVHDSKIDSSPGAIVIKTPKDSFFYYTQIPEKMKIKEIGYQLNAMVVIRNDQQVLMIFDNDFQVWNMFEDKNVLSIPRPFARKYFTEHGSRLIYMKN